MESTMIFRIVAAVLACIVLGVLIQRRRSHVK